MDPITLVYIDTPEVELTIKGPASHPAFPESRFEDKKSRIAATCAETLLSFQADGEELTHSTNVNYKETKGIRPLFFEQQGYEIIIECKTEHRASFWHENLNVRKNVSQVGRSGKILSGIINFGNEIGLSDFEIQIDGQFYLKLTIEVFPTKIDYEEDYKAIVEDVTNECYMLLFDVLKKTHEEFKIDPGKKGNLVTFYEIFRKLYNRMIQAVDVVLQKPHHLLQTDRVILPAHKAKRTDSRSLRWIEKHPESVLRKGDRYLIDRTMAVRKYVTYDTKENRLTKYMLENTARRLKRFQALYWDLHRKDNEEVMAKIDAMADKIKQIANTGFLREIQSEPTRSGMSLVFGMAPGYRELYRCYLLLQKGIQISGEMVNMSVKDMAELYEYWCFIKLNSLLRKKYELDSQNAIQVSSGGLIVTLAKGKESQIVYKDPASNEKITLAYNPLSKDLPTVAQKPDNVLELEKVGKGPHYKYVFDAKYRINSALTGSTYQKAYKTPGPQEDDINTMHRYRDAIVDEGTPGKERKMFGAYILFPYNNEDEYREHHFFKSIEQVNIGGLPFLPSATSLVEHMLEELISDTPQSAFERATLPVGIEERLAKVDWKKRDVLIGYVEDERQLDYFLSEKCYYIEKDKIARERLPLHYVALYKKGEGIRKFGQVLTVSERNGRYYFEVDSWSMLAREVKFGSYGPGPIAYTNYFLLTHSDTYPELHLKSEEEYRFYTELKRRSQEALVKSHPEGEKLTDFELKETSVQFTGDSIIVSRDGNKRAFSVMEFNKRPNATFRRIQEYVQGLKKSTSK